MKRPDDSGPSDDQLEAWAERALVTRGDLVPITEDEVRAAEHAGVEYAGALPAGLRELRDLDAPEEAARPGPRQLDPELSEEAPPRSGLVAPEPSQRVVNLADRRRARGPWSHLATFAVGAAVAAGAMLVARRPPGAGGAGREPAGSTGTVGEPAPSSSALAAVPLIAPVRACEGNCCGGASCAAATGEMRSCVSGRTCVGCTDVDSHDAYAVRIGDLSPTARLEGATSSSLDLCVKARGGDWTCVTPFTEAADRALPRTLGRLATVADLAAGLEAELRPHGATRAVASWRGSVRVSATVLCRGLGVSLADDKKQDLGSLWLSLDDPYYVELARAPDVPALEARRPRVELADVEPRIFERQDAAPEHFALAAGPFDRATADRLRWALLAVSLPSQIQLASDYRQPPAPLPAPHR